ncbi:metal-dependent protein hydrolase [Sphaerosporella brunnea]|uniref:Metal-dependent protein hydrolase n=1 Tax=Sphaerosporella brunnea TaxID=1250544 RepID=A0A5J5EE43_9PEZI|nr:metal-dependent protein hydrolase [Sphaerosporella brunnea]
MRRAGVYHPPSQTIRPAWPLQTLSRGIDYPGIRVCFCASPAVVVVQIISIITRRLLSTMSDDPSPAKRLKPTLRRIGTHNGHFHADEALAVYILRLLPEYSDAQLLRSRDPAALEECDIIVDVQGVYDGTKHFDHHQRTFSETFSPAYATKLSSAGLIYKHFAPTLIAQRLNKPVDDASVDLIYQKLYKEFIEALDANDNGISAYPRDVSASFSTGGITLPSMVAALNPSWNAPVDQAGEDQLFERASKLMGETFVRKLDYYANAWLPARVFVEEALAQRTQYDADGRILVFQQSLPWKDHLQGITEEGKKPLYVLYSEGAGKPNWRIQCVPVSKDSFESRKPLPEAWRGVRDDALSEVSGIPGGIFVHASGFIGGNKSFEGALAMAKKALEM